MTAESIKKTILLLEDEIIQQKMMSFILSNDYSLNIVSNGIEALNWLTKNSLPDLIIMDWVMPQMDGKTFLYNFKTKKEFSQIPVIALSSYQYVHQEISEIPYTPKERLIKPVEPQKLKTSIQEVFISRNS